MHITTRRKRTPLAAIFAAGLVAAGIIAASAAQAAAISDAEIPDDNLRACIKAELNINETDPIPRAAAEGLTALTCESAGIGSLEGLQAFTGLKDLDVKRNSISDATPLKDLTSLEELDIAVNDISDLAPLAGLVNLQVLKLQHLPLADFDFSLLNGLTSLRDLALQNNGISDVGVVSHFGELRWFTSPENHVTDISAFGGLPTNQLVGFSIPDQTVQLGEIIVGEPIDNPVIGLDGSAVELSDLYDDASNTFTPVTPGPGTVSWEVENIFPNVTGGYTNSFTGTISFTAVEPPVEVEHEFTISADPLEVEVGDDVTLSAEFITIDGDDSPTADVTGDTTFSPDDPSVDIQGATATFSAPGEYQITGTYGDYTAAVTITVTVEDEPGDDEGSEPGDDEGTEPGDDETDLSPTAEIGEITRDVCVVTIPVTTTGMGTFTLTVWDDQQSFETFDWEATTSPETTEVTWRITRPALEGAPGVAFVVTSDEEQLDSIDPYHYPAEVANQCAEEDEDEDESPAGPGQGSPTPPPTEPDLPLAQTLPETGQDTSGLALLGIGALMMIITGSAAILIRRRA